jgi:transcriptional regulator with XRE-family HTH domain
VTIAERLERLFAETAGPHGRPVTLQEIIQRMEQRGISSMSLSYLQQLRKGEAQNPRLQHLRALADAFGVPVSYFLEDDDSSTAEDRELTPQERTLAMRVHGLSDGALSSIRAIVELARKSEQLDDPTKGRGQD